MPHSHSPTIAIYGAGATGCYLATQLLSAQLDVTLICRQRIKAQIEQNHGLKISHYDGNDYQVSTPKMLTQVSQTDHYFDIVFVTLKCHQLQDLQDDLRKITHHNSSIIFMQNGLDSALQLIEHLYPRHCFYGITPFNVIQKDHGHYHQATQGKFILPDAPALKKLLVQVNQHHHFCELTQDIDAIINGKLLLNINNALNAICDLPLKTQLSQRPYRQLLAAAMQEWLLLCQHLERPMAQLTKVKPQYLPRILRLPDWLFSRLAKQMLDIDPTARSSMWQDIQDKRKTEIEFINGAIVRLAEENNISAPVNQAICQAIYQLEAGEQVNMQQLFAVIGK
ncbi:2-dehydropantoate 2-reductase [Shewanella maritima]|uniref:2-dehydropantoate 2-reductase n=1 Tax=Shewanella maritima TaxID=2520507 RepID=UPI003735A859